MPANKMTLAEFAKLTKYKMEHKRLEKHVQADILDYLVKSNIFHWRNNTGASKYTDKYGKERMVRYGVPGMSDILGIFKGKMFAIEVKGPNGTLTPLQEAFLKNVADNGGIACVAYDVADVLEIFNPEVMT